ncbi:MAG: hypothetical protein IKH16_02705 [Selenomonadaceae bacterium]|nr:hypothetical protein [Selenomonadaceae bacterium]
MANMLEKNSIEIPVKQEVYHLLEQLSEANMISVAAFIKHLLAETKHYENDQEDLREKEAAFAELLELREKISAANLPPVEEIR